MKFKEEIHNFETERGTTEINNNNNKITKQQNVYYITAMIYRK